MKRIDKLIVAAMVVIFLFSAVDKALHYQGFVNALRNYILVPRGLAPFLAMPIIALELTIGLGLLVRAWRSQAALMAAVTLSVFTVALALNYLLGSRGICGCWFTITLAKNTTTHLIQNVLMVGLTFATYLEARGAQRSLPHLEARSTLDERGIRR